MGRRLVVPRLQRHLPVIGGTIEVALIEQSHSPILNATTRQQLKPLAGRFFVVGRQHPEANSSAVLKLRFRRVIEKS